MPQKLLCKLDCPALFLSKFFAREEDYGWGQCRRPAATPDVNVVLNAVRLKSYFAAVPVLAGTLSELTTALRDEPARELFFECHRYLDLVRWGIVQETFYAVDQTECEGQIASTWATRTANDIVPCRNWKLTKAEVY